jgi:hypothetical protein
MGFFCFFDQGDQASIIGGAINFVKELEQRLQLLGVHKEMETTSDGGGASLPFSEFFTFPQYSTSSSHCDNNSVAMSTEQVGEIQLAIADIEVTMVESHASLKIRSKRRPKQLLKVVSGLHTMRLTVLHLNVTTVDEFVLYSLSVKVRETVLTNILPNWWKSTVGLCLSTNLTFCWVNFIQLKVIFLWWL